MPIWEPVGEVDGEGWSHRYLSKRIAKSERNGLFSVGQS